MIRSAGTEEQSLILRASLWCDEVDEFGDGPEVTVRLSGPGVRVEQIVPGWLDDPYLIADLFREIDAEWRGW